MTLSCGKTRRLLWPDEGPRVLTESLGRARAHLEECPACQSFMRDMDFMAGELRAAAPDVTAPLAVRNRLFASVARARTATPVTVYASVPRRIRWASAAAVAGLAVVAGLWTVRQLASSADDPFAPLAAEHAHADGGDGIESSDPSMVSEWLSSRVTFAARVPRFDDATLEGARLCMSQCGEGIVMHYRVATGMVSYYVVPQDEIADEPTPFGEFDHASRSGYRIVSWREPGLLHVMVGNVSEPQLTRLAHRCRTQFVGAGDDRVDRQGRVVQQWIGYQGPGQMETTRTVMHAELEHGPGEGPHHGPAAHQAMTDHTAP